MLLKSLFDSCYNDVRQVHYAMFGYSNSFYVLILNMSRWMWCRKKESLTAVINQGWIFVGSNSGLDF
jgi:hypothetical protein